MYAMMCVKCHGLIVVIKNRYSELHPVGEWEKGQCLTYNEHSMRHRIKRANTFENLKDRVYYIKLR